MLARDELNSARGHRPRAAARRRRGPRPLRDLQLAARPGARRIDPRDLGDPLPQSWQVAWGGHALQHQPLEFFQSNQFWPLDDTLAFSDALLGYAPAGLIGEGPEAAVVRYNLLFLFAYALCFAGAYLLARELGIGPAGRPSPAPPTRSRHSASSRTGTCT